MNYEFKGSKNSYAEVEDFEIQQKVLEGKLPPHLVKFDRNNHMRNYGRNNNTTVNASSNANTYIYNNKSSNININIHLDNPGQGPEVPDGPPQKKQRLEAPAPTTTKRSKSTSPPPQVASWQILNSEQLPSVSILKVDETSSEETPLGDDNGVLPSINELLQGVTSRNSTWHVWGLENLLYFYNNFGVDIKVGGCEKTATVLIAILLELCQNHHVKKKTAWH